MTDLKFFEADKTAQSLRLRSDTDEPLLFEAASIQAAGRHNTMAFVQVGGRRYAVKEESLLALAKWWGLELEKEG